MPSLSRRFLSARLAVLADAARTQIWPLPALGIGLAVAAAAGLTRLDTSVDGDLSGGSIPYLFDGGPDAARSVLGAIAGSMITVTSLTFSLTVVTLQLASGQFSPRLLRTFTRDRFVHVTLAIFLATFTFALTVLRTVRTDSSQQAAFVPQIAVTVAFALTVASVIGLVLFLAHLATEIRVETMLKRVHAAANETASKVLPEPQDPPVRSEPLPPAPDHAALLLAGSSGFLTTIDAAALEAVAVAAEAVIVITRETGSSIVARTPLGYLWRLDGRRLTDDEHSAVTDQVQRCTSVQFEHTAAHDIAYGLRQLTDVATKALSPGINDPRTAAHALAHSTSLLCDLTRRQLGAHRRHDDDGVLRVAVAHPDLEDLLELAVGQVRRYGAGDVEVLARLYDSLRELAWCVVLPEHRAVVADQLARLDATVVAAPVDPTERERLERGRVAVGEALAGRW